ncbi:MAG: glycosyltransferase family 1 protein, partial [Bacteroidia bacterium]|nr:glycosyltransferase family 1 protein [Bacteroidia bacterium]
MKFAVITHALHYREDKRINAYAPYVNEMNLWGRYVDQFLIVAPKASKIEPAINMAYEQDQIRWYTIPSFSITSIVNALSAIILIPVVFIQIFRACVVADHIHLRCPGNVGLLGCLVQIFFPGKPKTAKYAGNWGSNKKQPWS